MEIDQVLSLDSPVSSKQFCQLHHLPAPPVCTVSSCPPWSCRSSMSVLVALAAVQQLGCYSKPVQGDENEAEVVWC